jgi:uncharacterized iron-regulated membrane protein
VQLLRRVIFWCHLAAGLVAGTIVLIMSVTGVLLTYEKQIASWADTRAFQIVPGATRLPPDALIASARAAAGGAAATTLTVWSDPSAPAAVAVPQKTIYVDPYTGQALGESRPQPRAFFRKMTDWHRWLGASPEGRARGRMITGACNLAFLFLVVSGFYLWFPRQWTWRQLRAVTWFRRGLSAKARDFNWHNTIGLWSAIPLAVVVATSSSAGRGKQRRWRGRRWRRGEIHGKPRRGDGARDATRRRMAQHHRAHSERRRRDGGVHDRQGDRGTATEARHTDARHTDRRRGEVGALFVAEPGAPAALLHALRPHRRSVGPRRPDDRRTGVTGWRVPGLDRHFTLDQAALGLAGAPKRGARCVRPRDAPSRGCVGDGFHGSPQEFQATDFTDDRDQKHLNPCDPCNPWLGGSVA